MDRQIESIYIFIYIYIYGMFGAVSVYAGNIEYLSIKGEVQLI